MGCDGFECHGDPSDSPLSDPRRNTIPLNFDVALGKSIGGGLYRFKFG